MSRLLIPDAGPLFSLAAGDLLGLLGRFRVGLTDLVKEGTVGRGAMPGASIEATRILAWHTANSASIETIETQVGHLVKLERASDPAYRVPRNIGELSIQSVLIAFQMHARTAGAPPVVLFEDSWFLRNASGFAKPCIVLSTQAFLGYAERNRWIESAAKAREAISRSGREAARVNKRIDK